MAKQQVHFGVFDERYTTFFDVSQLRIGGMVHVVFDEEGKPRSFHEQPVSGSMPLVVTWIAPSEMYVPLAGSPKVAPDRVDQVAAVLEGLIDKATIAKAMDVAISDIELSHQYKTKEQLESRSSLVMTVTTRLELYNNLQHEAAAKAIWWHHKGLCSYLMLTCFDRLGQPASWKPFNEWLNSKKTAAEVETAMRLAAVKHDSQKDRIAEVYAIYNKKYSVTSSFYRFMREILPPVQRRELLDSIRIDKLKLPPQMGQLAPATDEDRERYLLRKRNEYTHQGLWLLGIKPALWGEETQTTLRTAWEHAEQFITANDWGFVFIRNWPDVLFQSVRVGLMEYLRRLAAEAREDL